MSDTERATLCQLQADLKQAVALMREHASKVGPMHSWWEFIFDFEAHLKKSHATTSPG